jgi:hypothetical protein
MVWLCPRLVPRLPTPRSKSYPNPVFSAAKIDGEVDALRCPFRPEDRDLPSPANTTIDLADPEASEHNMTW